MKKYIVPCTALGQTVAHYIVPCTALGQTVAHYCFVPLKISENMILVRGFVTSPNEFPSTAADDISRSGVRVWSWVMNWEEFGRTWTSRNPSEMCEEHRKCLSEQLIWLTNQDSNLHLPNTCSMLYISSVSLVTFFFLKLVSAVDQVKFRVW